MLPVQLANFFIVIQQPSERVGIATEGKGKSKAREGIVWGPSLLVPHSMPSTLSMPSSSAVDTNPSIAGLVRTSLGIDGIRLSLSPSAKERSKRRYIEI